MPTIRDAATEDDDAILALNLESEDLLSPMDRARLALLRSQAAYLRVLCDADDAVVAFLMAFREGADYDSPNYLWFAERYPSFLYIDRVVVSAAYQGQGFGKRLYDDLFAFARRTDIATVACEFYTVPLNEGSSRFHAKYGFREVGAQWVVDGSKQVSLQVATP